SQKGFELGFGGLFAATPSWQIAAGIKDWGGGAGQTPLPTTGYFAAAFSNDLGGSQKLELTGQADLAFNGVPSLNLGAQYGWKQEFFLRAGYAYPLQEQYLNGLQGL